MTAAEPSPPTAAAYTYRRPTFLRPQVAGAPTTTRRCHAGDFSPHGPPPLSLSPFSPCLTDDRRGHPEKQRRIIHHPAQRNGDQHKPLSKKVLHVRGAFAEPTSVTQSPTVPSAARSQRAFRVFFFEGAEGKIKSVERGKRTRVVGVGGQRGRPGRSTPGTGGGGVP